MIILATLRFTSYYRSSTVHNCCVDGQLPSYTKFNIFLLLLGRRDVELKEDYVTVLLEGRKGRELEKTRLV